MTFSNRTDSFIFPIIILLTLVEKFIAAPIERGYKTARALTRETQ